MNLVFLVSCYLSILACNSRSVKQPSMEVSPVKHDTTYILDLKSPSVAIPVSFSKAEFKFIQVHVARVSNPGLRDVSFNLHFQPGKGQRIFLGTFSLFPSNNPGKFIVATGGKINQKGVLNLSMILPPGLNKTDSLSVLIESVSFVNQ